MEEEEEQNQGVISPGTLIEQYTIGSLLLSTCSNAEIYECTKQQSRRKFIAKLVPKDVDNEIADSEEKALQTFNHTYLIHADSIKEYHTNYRIFFFPRCLEDLLDRIQNSENNLTEEWCARFFYLVAEGILYIHNQNYVHLDIKPENILIYINSSNMEEPRIIDFGFCTEVDEDDQMIQNTEPKGTPNYVAPEILNGDPYTFSADAWSYGITLYTALTKNYPWLGIEYDEEKQYTEEDFENLSDLLDEHQELSDSCKDILCQLLSFDPETRIPFEDILQHPWFEEYYPEQQRKEELQNRKLADAFHTEDDIIIPQ